jgi:fibronectin type 3 domain-containing protein
MFVQSFKNIWFCPLTETAMRKLFPALKMNLFLLLALSLIAGCGTGGLSDAPAGSSTGGTTGGTTGGATGKGSITFTIVKSSDPNTATTSILPDSPAIVQATAKDSTGAVIAGKVMSFSSTFDIKFSIVSGTVLTDSNGTAAITIMVGATAGAATITASISDSAGTAITNDVGITVNLKVPPAVPTGVTATTVSSTQINLSWTASAGATGYKIYRDGVLSQSVETTTSTNTGLTASTLYCYAVSSHDSTNSESVPTAQVCATTQPAPPPVPPPTPTGLTAAAVSQSLIDLSWTAVAGAAGYAIYRDGTYWTTVAGTTASDTGLTASTPYCYTITSLNSGGASAQSSSVCVTTPAPPPPVPTGLTVTPMSTSQLNIAWTASAGATGYKVYRGGVFLMTITATTLADTSLASATTYCYMISANAAGSDSATGAQVCAATNTIPVPANLTATAVSQSQIDISWTASAGVAGYRIYRDGTLLRSWPLTTSSDTGLMAERTYCYSVSAFDVANNESAKSSQLCATTYGPPPPVPAGVTVSATSPTRVDLSWTASAGASQYKIYRDGVLLASAPAPATSYADTTVSANTQYRYTVAAISLAGSESAQTAQTVAHTGLTVPSGVTATVNSSTQITLSWANSGGVLVTGYKIYRGGNWLGDVTATSIVDGGLEPNTQYCYSVSATSNAGGASAQSATVCGTTQPPPVPAAVDLLVSSPQLNSDGASTVTLTAVVKDSSNRTLSGQAVSFTAGSGSLTVTSGTTSTTGTATATLGTGGDRTNRTINLTASTAGINAANTVTVTGTTLSISGSSSISFGDSTPLTIFLKDSAGVGIAGKTVTVTSDKVNTLSAGPYVTDANGQVIVTVTAAVGGADKIRAAAIGATKEFDLTVNASILTFTSPAPPPAAVTEIAIGALQPVSVKYTIGGIAQVAVAVSFVTTRGTLSAASAVTDGSGVATVNVSATSSGPVLLLASVAGGPSAQVAAEFVATTVNSVTLQAVPNTIGTNSGEPATEKSLITAVVRDANNNLVKGKTVNFNIVNDASVGSLSPASSITDGSGTASTYFISGGAPSALNGVTIRGAVAGTAVTGTTTLTVAQKSLFITLATGPFLQSMPDAIRFKKEYVALVTDAAGDPVAGATIVATVTPVYYQKGYFIWPLGTTMWRRVVTLQAASSTLPGIPACANEDGITRDPLKDFNGILDAGEDQNGNSRLDPGNVASVTATVTDAAGHSTLTIIYAKDYAYWVNVKLEAFASTAGSTASAFVTFDLPGLAVEYGNASTSPPGNPSPFGMSTSCFVDLTVTPISDTQMAITWQKSATAASYNIYRDGGVLPITNVTTNTHNDTGLTAATQYCYQIKTVSALGVETAFTDTVCGTTNAVMPPTPTGLTATGGVLAAGPPPTFKVDLAWNISAGAVVYKLYRSGGEGSVTLAVAAPAVTLSDQSDSLKTATAYCYAISALDSAGNESAQSAQVCTATP